MCSKFFNYLKLIVGLGNYSVWNTIYLNFKVFSFDEARILPIKVGKHMEFVNLRKGCIKIDGKMEKYTIRLGISPVSMFAERDCCTLLRFGNKGVIHFGNNVDVYSGCSLLAGYESDMYIG